MTPEKAKLPRGLALLCVGHRHVAMVPDAPGSIEDALRSVLTEVARHDEATLSGAVYDQATPIRRHVITGAEAGADALVRRVARSGIDGNWQLSVLTPFALPSDLRENETAVALGAPRGDDTQASDPNVELVIDSRDTLALSRADAVVAIWNGEAGKGHLGGTARLVRRAALDRKPVLRISPDGRLSVLRHDVLTDAELFRLEALDVGVAELTRHFVEATPLAAAQAILAVVHDPGIDSLSTPTAERTGLMARALALSGRLALSCCGLSMRAFRRQGRGIHPSGGNMLDELHVVTHRRADAAMDISRGSHLFVLVVATLAVLLATVAAVRGHTLALAGVEILLLLLAAIVAFSPSIRATHRQWTELRALAEHLRVHLLLEPAHIVHAAALRSVWGLQGEGKGKGMPPAAAETLQVVDRAGWMFQRCISAAGFVGRETLDHATIAATITVVAQSQHLASRRADLAHLGRWFTRIEHAEHRLSPALFIAGLLAAIILAVNHHVPDLSIVAIGAPAAAAAVTGLAERLEARRLATLAVRSQALLGTILQAAEVMAKEPSDRPWLQSLGVRRVLQHLAEEWVAQTDGWQSTVRPRGPATA